MREILKTSSLRSAEVKQATLTDAASSRRKFLLFILSFLAPKGGLEMTPVLFATYVMLAKREEQSMLDLFGDDYRAYAATTPRFFRPVSQWKAFLLSPIRVTA